MLRTLFLEEIRAQGLRNAVVLGCCLLGLLGCLGVWWLFSDVSALAFLMQVGAIVALVAMPTATLVHVAVEYWQSMYGERGYLTQMVPVRGRTLFTAKVLYACLVGLVVSALSVAGMLAYIAISLRTQGLSFSEALRPLLDMFDQTGTGLVVFLVMSPVVGILAMIVEVAAVMSIGAQSRFSHLGWAAPVVGFVALYFVNQVLGVAAFVLVPLSLDLTTGGLEAQWMLPQFVEAVRTGGEPSVVGLGSVFVGPLLAAALSLWAVRSLERHMALR